LDNDRTENEDVTYMKLIESSGPPSGGIVPTFESSGLPFKDEEFSLITCFHLFII